MTWPKTNPEDWNKKGFVFFFCFFLLKPGMSQKRIGRTLKETGQKYYYCQNFNLLENISTSLTSCTMIMPS